MALTLRKPDSIGAWAVVALGVVMFAIGVVLLVGGVWLAAVGGSWYYMLAGAALCAAGAALVLGMLLGSGLHWLLAKISFMLFFF